MDEVSRMSLELNKVVRPSSKATDDIVSHKDGLFTVEQTTEQSKQQQESEANLTKILCCGLAVSVGSQACGRRCAVLVHGQQMKSGR